ncbi:MAG: putative O-glycosylation ligase, exosortase A system-associated [Sedimenticola sp.]|nr:putative O-glycosylation ligase, exosortase A system-associated [Sedimenticola sp.]
MKALLILTIFTLGILKALQMPHFGVYLMSWISYMNPHRMVPWSFIYSLPLAAIAFAVTLVGYIFYKDKPKKWFDSSILLLIALLIWGGICASNAIYPEFASIELIRFIKIQLSIILTILIINKKQQLLFLVWVIFLSIGFFGIKGGAFTIMTAGSYLVWGPAGSFIQGNNELGLALLMVLPLGYFLYQQYENIWVKRFIIISMLLIIASVLGTHSRGALLALIASGTFLWFKSRSKLPIALFALVCILAALPMMPQSWFDRMASIQTYEQDASAMGRINAWSVAINVANDRLTGGGYNMFQQGVFNIYAPNPLDVHDVHSIYFEVLGEMGYPGLILFLLVLANIWFGAKKNIRQSNELKNKTSEHIWVAQLNRMLQVSLIAYMTGGAFLGLAYWDLPYHLLALIVCCKNYLHNSKSSEMKFEKALTSG